MAAAGQAYGLARAAPGINTVKTVAHSVHYMPQTCLKMPMPLINYTASNTNTNTDTISDLYFTDCLRAMPTFIRKHQ